MVTNEAHMLKELHVHHVYFDHFHLHLTFILSRYPSNIEACCRILQPRGPGSPLSRWTLSNSIP